VELIFNFSALITGLLKELFESVIATLKKCILVVLLLCFFQGRTTTRVFLDSIQALLRTTNNNAEKLNYLYTLSYEYGLIDPVQGIRFGWQCLDLAINEKNLFYQLNGYNGLANSYETLANFDSAGYFHYKSYEIAKQLGSPQKMALTMFNVGLCYKQQGDYRKALQHYLTAYRLFDRDSVYNPRIHFYIGEIYMRLGNYDQAEHQSRKGIKKCKEFNHNYIIYNMYMNLAKCHTHNNKLDSAILLLNDALKGLQQNTDEISIGVCYNSLGEAYMKKKNYELAHDSYIKDLTIHQKLKNDNGILLAFINLAHSAAHFAKKDLSLISGYLNTSELQQASNKNKTDVLLEAFLKTGETYELINNPNKALVYYKKYFALRDSLLNKEKVQQLMELQTKYETEKKEGQIIKLEKEQQIQALKIKKKNILIVFSAFLLISIVFFVYFYFNKQKLKSSFEKELAIKETEEKERLRMAKDIHDDLGSGLSKISFLSELIIRSNNLNKEVAENAGSITETSKKLVVNMRDLIWALDPANVTLPGLYARIREYSADYLEDFSIELILKINDDMPQLPITRGSHREILMVVKESLNNIIKHSKATQVEIESSISNSDFMITIKDNGTGVSEVTNLGNGIKNMRNRVESLNGQFSINNNTGSGTIIKVNIPLNTILKS